MKKKHPVIKYHFLVSIFLVLSGLSHAGEFRLVSMDKVSSYSLNADGLGDVCKDYVKNLNYFKDEPPMVCERKLHAEMTDFSRPDWKMLDIKKHAYLAYEISDLRARRQALHMKEGSLDKLIDDNRIRTQQWISGGVLLMQLSYFDFDGIGEKNWVLKWEFKVGPEDCKSEMAYMQQGTGTLFILQKKNEKWEIDEVQSQGLTYTSSKIFLYKGHAFSDKWMGGDPIAKTAYIDVSRINYNENTEQYFSESICRIDYKE